MPTGDFRILCTLNLQDATVEVVSNNHPDTAWQQAGQMREIAGGLLRMAARQDGTPEPILRIPGPKRSTHFQVVPPRKEGGWWELWVMDEGGIWRKDLEDYREDPDADASAWLLVTPLPVKT
jgi:hypothetical protein